MSKEGKKKENAIEYLTKTREYSADEVFVTESDGEFINEAINLVEQLFPEKVVILCRHQHKGLFYTGRNTIDLWGYPPKTIEGLSVEEMFGLIHPEDADQVICGLNRLKDLGYGFSPLDIKFVFTYRMKTASGEYIYVRDEKVAIKTRNNTFAYFNVYSKIKDYKGPVTLEVSKRMGDHRMVKVHEYTIQLEGVGFSPREVDIIKLIDKGFNNSEIAASLSLSIFTVKNHKQNLFKKASVKNSLELLRHARTSNVV